MDAPEIYLDHAADTPLDPRVRAAMLPWLEPRAGNPSSRHPLGVRAREAIDRARAQVAAALATRVERVVFTSGGTEANALAVLGFARAAPRECRRVLIGATEHACVRESALALRDEGFRVDFAHLDEHGALDLADFERQLGPDLAVVALMLANNEFGTVYPIPRVARLVRSRAPLARLHVDAVQGFGKLECSPLELGADSIAISSHKVHGPHGAGALVLAGEFALRPLVFGGGQEHGLRSGTENVPAIVGFGRAAELAERELDATVAACSAARARMREYIESIPGARVLEPGAAAGAQLCSILSTVLPGVPAEVRMHHLETRGVYVSAGAACQARKKERSSALAALGLATAETRFVLRFSFARTTTLDEIDAAIASLREVSRELDPAVHA